MEALPLEGRTVLVTRSADQAEGLAGPLADLGADVVVMPVIEIVDPADPEPLSRAARGAATYDWIVLGSTNAVDRFLDRVDAEGADLGAVRVAAVGAATAERLRERGIEPGLVPADFRAEGLVAAFAALPVAAGARVLVPRAAEGREVLREGLAALGCEVDVVAAYRTVPAAPDPVAIARLAAGDVDAVTFTSPSTAKHFFGALRAAGLDADDLMAGMVIATIGPVTTAALRGLGFTADVEADPSTMTALAEALAERLCGDLGPRR